LTNIELAAFYTKNLSAVGSLIASLEVVVAPQEYASGGIHSATVFLTRGRFLSRLSGIEGFVSERGIVTVHALKIVAALVLLSPGLDTVYASALFATLLLHNVGIYRGMVGGDGSDQMLTIIAAGLAVYYAFPDSATGMLGIYFIVAQSLLAYAAAGISKLASRTWRSGMALRLILGTMTYGSEGFSVLLDRYPSFDAAGSYATILLECALPLSVLLPQPLMLVLLCFGAAFHAACAVAMGLNCFFWQFVSTYPLIIVVSVLIRNAN